MYGTDAPWSVVVIAIDAAGTAAVYGLNECVAASMYWNVKGGAPSPCAFVGTGKPAIVLQIHGCTWAPAKTGPPLGWFVTVRCTVGPLRIVAIRSLAPLARPVTTPSYAPPGRTANAEVTSLPSTVT